MNLHRRPILKQIFSAAASLPLLASAAAAAQTSTEPSAIERTIPRETKERTTDPAVRTNLPDAERGPAIQGSFILGAVHVAGATAFSTTELAAVYEPYLASEVDDARLRELVGKITALYRGAGYSLSYAMLPLQDVRAGVVRIDVVEGRIDTVEIEGAGDNALELKAIAAPLLDERPLRTATLERVLGLIRDLPGFFIADVRVGRASDNLADHQLAIQIVRNRVRALAYADNRGTVRDGRVRLYTSLGVASVAATGDELRLSSFAIPGDGFRYLYGQASYATPIGHDGLMLDLSASYGDQYQREAGMPIDGSSTNFLAQLRYPMVRSRALTAVGKIAVSDWRSISRHDVTRLQRDRLRVARLGLGITQVSTGQINADFWLARGLGFGAASRPGDPLASRLDAGGKFTKASAAIQLAQPLTPRITLRAAAAGQYASRPLLSVEEFALGGSQIGRAYDFNALVGDHGFGGAFELGYRIGSSRGALKHAELFGYVDGGAVFQDGDPVGFADRQALVSAGGGARFTLAGVSIVAEAGVPLQTIARSSNVRAFVSASKAF